jgi:glucose-1-phosphate thymidylyltransferase
VEIMGRGFAWLGTGTHESLLDASRFIQTIQQRQGQMVASPDEIAFRNGYISVQEFEALSHSYAKSAYGAYLAQVLDEMAMVAPR